MAALPPADGVAFRHAPIKSNWPQTWQDVLPVFKGYLERRLLGKSSRNGALSGFHRLIAALPPNPRDVTEREIAEVVESSDYRGGPRVALSHLCLMLIEMGIWPREYLPPSTGQDTLRKCLPPQWSVFAENFRAFLKREGVPHNVVWEWAKWITTFLWWSGLPESESLDADKLRDLWDGFCGFLVRRARDASYNNKAYQRAFAAFWNFAIEERLLQAEPLPLERVATTFWNLLQEPLRVPLHKKYPLVHGIEPDQDCRPHVLKYALHLLGFSIHAPARPMTVAQGELEQLRTKLVGETFSPEVVQVVLDEIAEIGNMISGGLHEDQRRIH